MSAFLRLGLAVVAVALVGQVGSAEPLPDWSFRNPLNETAFPAGATGGLSFSNSPFQVGGSGEFVASRVASFSIAQAGSPDAVSNLPYSFTLEVRDNASLETGRLTFAGLLNGSMWRTGSDLTNQFTGPLSKSVELGDHTFAVTLTGFTSPTGYGEPAAGSITARLSVVPVIPDVPSPPVVVTPGPPSPTPEPATLLLALVGGVPLVARRLRRKGV